MKLAIIFVSALVMLAAGAPSERNDRVLVESGEIPQSRQEIPMELVNDYTRCLLEGKSKEVCQAELDAARSNGWAKTYNHPVTYVRV